MPWYERFIRHKVTPAITDPDQWARLKAVVESRFGSIPEIGEIMYISHKGIKGRCAGDSTVTSVRYDVNNADSENISPWAYCIVEATCNNCDKRTTNQISSS